MKLFDIFKSEEERAQDNITRVRENSGILDGAGRLDVPPIGELDPPDQAAPSPLEKQRALDNLARVRENSGLPYTPCEKCGKVFDHPGRMSTTATISIYISRSEALSNMLPLTFTQSLGLALYCKDCRHQDSIEVKLFRGYDQEPVDVRVFNFNDGFLQDVHEVTGEKMFPLMNEEFLRVLCEDCSDYLDQDTCTRCTTRKRNRKSK